MNILSDAGMKRESQSAYFINGHGPFSAEQTSVAVDDFGTPEGCGDDAPVEGCCQRCQVEINLRRWTAA